MAGFIYMQEGVGTSILRWSAQAEEEGDEGVKM
jgi:hypothetical protein